MAKAKFTYDESGSTFFYFVLSFLALILVPSTYYLWPDNESQDENQSDQCWCNGCRAKKDHLSKHYKWKRSRRKLTKFLITIGWLLFLVVAYKCSTQRNEYVNWDPFEILGLPETASSDDIKKTYRALSLKYHPDKATGDPDKFVKISKAYAALTDEDSRKNWEQYGNPDGPGATSFGIALPSWIIEKENSVFVLGVYILLFMVVLPTSVGAWWYKSVKYGGCKVLVATTELYYYFIHRTPNMAIKRAITIIAASLEFSKTHNGEVVERPEDNIEVPKLMREFSTLGDKNKERPLCYPYSVKARTILFAHLSRLKLPANTLELDRCLIVRKCPYLLQEFVQCISQLITLALSGRMQSRPTLLTLENAMKLSPMIVQALWEYQSPLLQLPHFTEEIIRQLERRKSTFKTIEDLAKKTDSELREALSIFNDSQYIDIKYVIDRMPVVDADCTFEVLDDEEPEVITAGSIVTVRVKLTRTNHGKIKQIVKPQSSHTVHCPYFSDEKQEFWWVYLVDRKRSSPVTAPVLITTLVESEQIELKFTAPLKPGSYNYTLVVRSDSYFDAIIQKQTKVDVMPMRDYVETINDVPDEEEEELISEESGVEDSDLLTDSDN